MPAKALQGAWNRLSPSYQRYTRISTDDVHYGSLSPGELELHVLGVVRGKRILELGCGGGQNCVALAKWGARPTGIDFSTEQIRFARSLAAREGVQVDFQVRRIEELHAFATGSFDLALSSFAFEFVEDLRGVCSGVYRLLLPGGAFVLADLHPIAGTGRIARRRGRRAFVLDDYFRHTRQTWQWPRYQNGTSAIVHTFPRTIGDYFSALSQAGFTITRLVEPAPYPRDWMTGEKRARIPCYAPAVANDYSIWRRVPYTIIFRAER